jgi:hypothetical protein
VGIDDSPSWKGGTDFGTRQRENLWPATAAARHDIQPLKCLTARSSGIPVAPMRELRAGPAGVLLELSSLEQGPTRCDVAGSQWANPPFPWANRPSATDTAQSTPKPLSNGKALPLPPGMKERWRVSAVRQAPCPDILADGGISLKTPLHRQSLAAATWHEGEVA